ncbi:MAG: hypothetical protein V4635_11545 [Bacteroidota bacterium]
MLKNLLIALFILGSFSGRSQILVNTIPLGHDTCINKQFSIVFYIVLDSNYSVMSATQQTLDAIIDTLNATFKPICVSFASCSTVLIPNYPYNRWLKYTTDTVVTSNWYTDKTINFYIVDSVKDLPYTERGYGYAPPLPGNTPKDVIVMEQLRFPLDFYHMMHNVGHFFGLSHTYDELAPTPPQSPGPPPLVDSQEFADGSNNTVHGDLLDDTEADPGPVPEEFDGKGDPYIRPLDNFMSFFVLGSRFSQRQMNLMAWYILNRRLYLH